MLQIYTIASPSLNDDWSNYIRGMRILSAIILSAFIGIACNPLDPCIQDESYSVKLGDTVFVKSCAENAELYSWEMNDERVNTFLNPPKPFFSHYADSGGGPCDKFVYLIFHDTGMFKLRCVIGKTSNGTCSDDLTPRKTEQSIATIYVADTARTR